MSQVLGSIWCVRVVCEKTMESAYRSMDVYRKWKESSRTCRTGIEMYLQYVLSNCTW
jgi:hypothetical protein